MTGVAGQAIWPGHDPLAAQLQALDGLGGPPFGVTAYPSFVQLPGRGPGADLLGRTLALLEGMPTELGLHGWKMAQHKGIDLERAQTFLAQDLEAISIAGAGYTGELTLGLIGPWTLAATLYLNTGDRILTDPGAVRELSQALSDAAQTHIAQVRERVPGATLTVQFDETLIGQVAAGVIPTFSGYSRIRSVTGITLVERMKPVIAATKAGGAKTIVHVGQAFSGIAPVVHAKADSFGMDFVPGASWNEPGWELIARALEKDMGLWANLPAPVFSRCSGPDLKQLIDLVMVGWSRIGIADKDLNKLIVAQSKAGARQAFQGGEDAISGSTETLMKVAEHLAERAAQ